MKKLNFKGKDYTVRTESKDITLKELVNISTILSNENTDYIEKWMGVIAILGSNDLVEVISINKFTELVNEISFGDVQAEIRPQIEVNNRVYRIDLVEGKLDLTAKEVSKIEKIARAGGNWGLKAFAFMYRDESLTNVEHFEDAHISHKAKLFEDTVSAEVATPVIFELSKHIVSNISDIINANSKAVSGAE
jgi:hypothetical protein